MITKSTLLRQLPKDFVRAFQTLRIGQHLRRAHITKGFGYSCLELFQIIFLLAFDQKNWYQTLMSRRGDGFPGKDAVYRFLNSPYYNWRRFLYSLAESIVERLSPLTSDHRVKTLIIDDSVFSRNRSKAVELLARIYDHVDHCYLKGFQMLTLGWSDGASFLPIDFSLMSSPNRKNQLNGVDPSIDKRTNGYQRRKEAIQSKPDVISQMVDQALKKGLRADYVLMDSWFTEVPLIEALCQKGLNVIGMVKRSRRFQFHGESLTLKQLYDHLKKGLNKRDIHGSLHVQLSSGRPAKIVFIRNRSNPDEWLTVLSTDTTLTDEEIIRLYGRRWQVEAFFKQAKSQLKLAKEFQGRSYDMMVGHTTIVFARYLLLAWQQRQQTDPKTLGELFMIMCDEARDMDYVTALSQLFEIVETIMNNLSGRHMNFVKNQVIQWFSQLPRYIRGLLPELGCES